MTFPPLPPGTSWPGSRRILRHLSRGGWASQLYKNGVFERFSIDFHINLGWWFGTNFLARLAKPKWAGKQIVLEDAAAQAAALLASEFQLAEAWLQQIQIGNKLLRFLLEMLLALAAQGFSGFLEHPQFPTWLQTNTSASIRTLETIRCMKHMCCVSVISFDQCICGALGRKPTTLLLVRLREVRHHTERRLGPMQSP